MLQITQLTKRFGARTLFHHVDLALGPGCYAVTGPNGCGKSTLLAILAGVEPADAGTISIAGHPLEGDALGAKARLSYVPDNADAYPFMTGRALLELIASAKSVPPTDGLELALAFRLEPHLDKRFEQMSFGTQKKMLLAATALGAPSVILADEPSNGLDAATRRVLIERFKAAAPHAVVLFSTHDPEFAEACDATLIAFDSLSPAAESDAYRAAR
jgi:ABC-2 type transport system ATP-binding protein